MINVRRVLGVAIVASGAVVACSTGSSGAGGGSGGVSDSQAFINQFCEIYAPCCGKINKPTDGAACRNIFGALLGGAQYDPAKGADCLAAERATQSKPNFCDNAGSESSCKGAFKQGGAGTKKPGETCANDGDCASPADGKVVCATSFGSSNVETKACQIQVDGKEGDMPCIGTKQGDITSFSGFSSGADAGMPGPPAKGFVCDVANGVYCSSKTRLCTKVQPVGGSCDGSDSYSCEATATCDSATQKCVARIAIGSSCAKFPSVCVQKSYCDTSSRVCTAAMADGTPCTSGEKCAAGFCVNGKCGNGSTGSFSQQLFCGN